MKRELIDAYLDEYFTELKKAAAEQASSPRLRSPKPAADVDDFFRLVGQAIKNQQELDGATTPILYTEDMPENDDNITGEVVTFSLKQRRPGTWEQVQMGLAMDERRRRTRIKMFRENIDDPDNPGMKILSYGQEYDNYVVFKCWARTNKIANRRALWLENLMEDWRWYFEASGIKHVYFQERGMDVQLAPENRKLVCRPIVIYLRTEKVTVIKEYSLRSLIVSSSNSST